MFGRKKTPSFQIEEDKRRLVAENEQLIRENERLNAVIESLAKSASDSDIVLDFQTMNVFSIERIPQSDGLKTVVGYFIQNGDKQVVKEWYLYCTDRVYNNLIQQFQAYIKSKENLNGNSN